LFEVVAQSRSNFADCCIDTVLGIQEYVFAPESVRDLLACDELSRFFRKQNEQFKRTFLKLDHATAAPQFEPGAIQFEFVEFHQLGRQNKTAPWAESIALTP
jgi:hypothetical protein